MDIIHKDINGRRYETPKLAAKAGRKLLLRLTKVVGPFIAVGSAGGGLTSIDARALVSALEGASEEELEHVLSVLTAKAQVEVSPDRKLPLRTETAQDEVWAGNYGEMMEFMVWALGANFEGFFDMLRAKLKAARTKAEVEKMAAAISPLKA